MVERQVEALMAVTLEAWTHPAVGCDVSFDGEACVGLPVAAVLGPLGPAAGWAARAGGEPTASEASTHFQVEEAQLRWFKFAPSNAHYLPVNRESALVGP